MATGEQPDTVLETAMDWLLRLQSVPEDHARRRAFESWLAADPAHAAAWTRAQKTWSMIGETKPVTADRWARDAAAGRARSNPRRSNLIPARPVAARGAARSIAWGAVAAGLAAGIALMVAPTVGLRLQADYLTGAGELKRVTLEDGTVVELAPESAIATRYGAGRREVALLAGEAFFDVKHDAAHPFAVVVKDATVTDIGTAFDIRLETRTTTIDVQRGAVIVTDDHASPALDARLQPGDRLTIDRSDGAVQRGGVDADQVADWRDRHLYVKDATLADVAERLRPYVGGWIVIPDAALASRRVTGLYDLTDPERALQALVGPAGGRVRRITPLLYVLSSS